MEQIDLFVCDDPEWVKTIKKTIEKKATEEKLPNESLVLISNMTKDGKEISSYSIVVRKPDYPKGINSNGQSSTSLINIKGTSVKGKKYIEIPTTEKLAKEIIDIHPTVSIISGKSNNSVTKIRLSTNDFQFEEIINSIVRIVFEEYISSGVGQSFGCCHLFKECSDARECLHENKLYAKGCKYYQNLRKGIIFYGENRNID